MGRVNNIVYESKKIDTSNNLQIGSFKNQILSRVDYTNMHIYP